MTKQIPSDDDKTGLSMLIARPLKERLQALAGAEQRSLSNYVERALAAHVEKKREGKRK